MIPNERLREIERRYDFSRAAGLYVSPDEEERHDFALELLKAREVLRKSYDNKEYCTFCGNTAKEFGGNGHAPDCALKDLLNDD